MNGVKTHFIGASCKVLFCEVKQYFTRHPNEITAFGNCEITKFRISKQSHFIGTSRKLREITNPQCPLGPQVQSARTKEGQEGTLTGEGKDQGQGQYLGKLLGQNYFSHKNA